MTLASSYTTEQSHSATPSQESNFAGTGVKKLSDISISIQKAVSNFLTETKRSTPHGEKSKKF